MATQVYKKENIYLIDGTELEIIPLKIKYLREFMSEFESIYSALNDDESINVLLKCVNICMKQYCPKIVDKIEENFDLPTIYTIIEIGAGIKMNKKSKDPVKEQATSNEPTWKDLDLVKLEAEVFILGIWKDYQELEESLSMPELMITLSSKRELDYEEKKFLAAIQGVNLDEATGSNRGQKEWEDMKARVFSKGATSDSNDVLSLQGQNAKKAGFGINMGLDYEDARDPSLMKN
jgi:hypothetical protein